MENKRVKRSKPTKDQVKRCVKEYSLVLLGCLLVALADALFITPCNIVCGGVASIGIIINHYLEPIWGFDTNSTISAIVQVILLLVGWIVLGKNFGLKTVFAGLAFAGLYAAFMALNIGPKIGLAEVYEAAKSNDFSMTGTTILMGLAGGAVSGIGVAVSYIGGGSTAGLDILSRIMAKYTVIKEDLSSFIFDGILVIIGIVVFRQIIPGLIGILTAFVTAVAIQYVYIYLSSYIIVDIISDKYEEIQKYVHEQMGQSRSGHGTTLIDSVGGYSGQPKKLLRVVIYHHEEVEIRELIARVDPTAFVVFSQARGINGEGFDPLVTRKRLNRVTKRPKTKVTENEEQNKE